MDIKDIAVVFGALLLVACLYYYFYYYPTSRDFFFGRNDVSYADANAQLMAANSVCLVENISVADPTRMNIMNCGIDFAASFGGIKGVDAYAIEGENCTSMSGLGSINDCAREIHSKGCYIIFIGSDETGPRTLDGLTYVPVSGTYQNLSCSIKVS